RDARSQISSKLGIRWKKQTPSRLPLSWTMRVSISESSSPSMLTMPFFVRTGVDSGLWSVYSCTVRSAAVETRSKSASVRLSPISHDSWVIAVSIWAWRGTLWTRILIQYSLYRLARMVISAAIRMPGLPPTDVDGRQNGLVTDLEDQLRLIPINGSRCFIEAPVCPYNLAIG